MGAQAKVARGSVALGLLAVGVLPAPRAGAEPANFCQLTLPPPAYRAVQASGLRLYWKVQPGPIRVGKPFAVEVVACPAGTAKPPTRMRVDARMPAHGHGMNYKTTRKALAPGRERFDGLLFHMPGAWELVIDLYGPAGRRRVTVKLDVNQ